MKNIIIVGAGGHAAELVDYITHYNKVWEDHNQINLIGLLDDEKSNFDHYEYQKPFLGPIKDHEIRLDVEYLMGIANLKFRKQIVEEFESKGAVFTGFVHPTAQISPSAKIGKGVVISHSTSLGPKVDIGDHTIINSRCTIGHDTHIGKFNFISPIVALSGNTKIGENNLIGTNVITIPGTEIGDNNKIGAGVVLFFNVASNKTIVGNKPRIIDNE
jgi:acetyltransferase EpsM